MFARGIPIRRLAIIENYPAILTTPVAYFDEWATPREGDTLPDRHSPGWAEPYVY